jgi:hypothetical protein
MTMSGALGVAGGGGSERAAIQALQDRVWKLEDLAGLHVPPVVVDVPHAYVADLPADTPIVAGAIVTCTMGNWEGEPDAYAYQWLRGGTDIVGGTANLYTVTPEDAGSELACKVVVSNPYGQAESTSNPVLIAGEIPPARSAGQTGPTGATGSTGYRATGSNTTGATGATSPAEDEVEGDGRKHGKRR